MDQERINTLAQRNEDYIRDALLRGLNNAPDIFDSWCQFLCDTSQEFQLNAYELEKLSKTHPRARILREISKRYLGAYRELESLQRQGLCPTNLKDINDLTGELE